MDGFRVRLRKGARAVREHAWWRRESCAEENDDSDEECTDILDERLPRADLKEDMLNKLLLLHFVQDRLEKWASQPMASTLATTLLAPVLCKIHDNQVLASAPDVTLRDVEVYIGTVWADDDGDCVVSDLLAVERALHEAIFNFQTRWRSRSRSQ